MGLFDHSFQNLFLKTIFYYLTLKQFLKISLRKHSQTDSNCCYMDYFQKLFNNHTMTSNLSM